MNGLSKFDCGVLALTAVTLLFMTGWFLTNQKEASDTWRVEVQRSDSPQASVQPQEDGWPDSLLEGEVIDLNTATQGDLERLPGIGAGKAGDILVYRQEHGPFAHVEDLLQVDGIGNGILERVRPYVKVE